MREVRIEDGDRACVDFVRWRELLSADERVVSGIGEREGEVGLAVTDELHVRNGSRRGLRACRNLHFFREDVSQAGAIDDVDAASSPRGDVQGPSRERSAAGSTIHGASGSMTVT